MKRYIFLFTQFFKIGLLVVGGGLAMLPVIEQIFVQQRKLLSEDDFVEMVALTQTIPGLIAVNSSIFVGYKVAGFFGSLFAMFGVILPSLVILSLIAAFFPLLNVENNYILTAFDCVRASVTGIFLVMFVRMFRRIVENVYVLLIVLLLAGMFFIPLKTGWIILTALCIGVVYVKLLQHRVLKKEEISNG